MNRLIWVLIVGLVLGMVGCGQEESEQEVSKPEDKSLENQNKADLVISLDYRPGKISVWKPRQEENKYLPQDEFLKLLPTLDIKRNLVVVNMCKLIKEEWSNKEMDEMEKILKEQGFKKVIFEAGTNTWTPDGKPVILRETDLTD